MPMKLALAAIAFFALALPAAAEGPWQVGDSYVVRAETLDLSTATDRRRLLDAVEEGAERACEGVRTRGARKACKARAVERALARAPHAREALTLARNERDGVRLADSR